MAKVKKFKTVAGFLTSISDDYHHQKAMKRGFGGPKQTKEEIIASAHDDYRRAINGLLPNFQITERVKEDEKPKEGLERIKAALTDPEKVKRVDECLKWLKRQIIVLNVEAVPSHRVVDGKRVTTYEISGFRRDDHQSNVVMILDIDDDDDRRALKGPGGMAQDIAGPEYCFHCSANVSPRIEIPGDLKGKVLTYEQLYERVPELDYSARRKRA